MDLFFGFPSRNLISRGSKIKLAHFPLCFLRLAWTLEKTVGFYDRLAVGTVLPTHLGDVYKGPSLPLEVQVVVGPVFVFLVMADQLVPISLVKGWYLLGHFLSLGW